MRNLRLFAGLAILALLAGCATGYHKRGLTGRYQDRKLDDNHYAVFFDGNGYASKDRVYYFWIYRCAELTSQLGFSYFSVSPFDNDLKKTSFDPVGDGRLYPAVFRTDDAGKLIDVHGSGGGGVHVIMMGGAGSFTTWHSKALVTMYKDVVPAHMAVYSAQSVLDMASEYIRTDGKAMPPARSEIFNRSAYGLATDGQLVNIHQFLLAHPGHQPSPAAPVRQQPLPWMSGPVPPPPRSYAASPVPVSPVLAPASPMMPSASPWSEAAAPNGEAAQAVAKRLGCGTVHANGDSTFTASCNQDGVLIGCDGGQCRPMHSVKLSGN